ncbi:TY1B-LR3, partial [Symbiodinium sp. CCMP2456]
MVPTLLFQAGQLPLAPAAGVNQELAWQMLQAQDEQIRQQSAQIAQMTVLLQRALELANTNARAAAAPVAGPVVNTSGSGGEATVTTTVDTSGPMEVDTGLRSRYAEELNEAEQSSFEVKQAALVTGKAARSTNLWFLLKQSMSRFQRAVAIARYGCARLGLLGIADL